MQNNQDWAKEKLEQTIEKVKEELKHLGDGIPYVPKNGRYEDIGKKEIAWWTNGFWAGLLWQLYHYTKDETFSKAAGVQETRLDKALEDFEEVHHDVGFMWLHSAVASYRETGNHRSFQRGLHAANTLAGRFNVEGNFIIAWNQQHPGWIIIDSMMNIPILYWASKELNDPRFEKIARLHADTVAKYLIREDGSSGHIASFNPETGEFIEQIGGQGYAANSAWTRGNAWAVYGFALSYHHTKEEKYLLLAKRVANWFIANVAQTEYIAPVDFCSPEEPVGFDTSAGLIAACGMFEIAEHVGEYEKKLYQEVAVKIVQATEKKYANWNKEEDAIIQGGTEAYHAKESYNIPLIYSDYFFTEALLRMVGQELFIW